MCRRTLLFVLSLSACAAENEGMADEQGLGDEGTSGDGAIEAFATVEGRIVEREGGSLPQLRVSFCGPNESDGLLGPCIAHEAKEDGSYVFPAKSAGSYKLSVTRPAEDEVLYSHHIREVVTKEGMNEVPAFSIPQIESFSELEDDAGEVESEAGAGLSVSFDPARFTYNPGEVGVGAGRVAPEDWPWFSVGEAEEEVLGVWAFMPFGVKGKEEDDRIEVTLADNLGLDPGTEVSFYEVDKSTGWAKRAGVGSVDESGEMIRSEGPVLHALTWVVVTTAD